MNAAIMSDEQLRAHIRQLQSSEFSRSDDSHQINSMGVGVPSPQALVRFDAAMQGVNGASVDMDVVRVRLQNSVEALRLIGSPEAMTLSDALRAQVDALPKTVNRLSSRLHEMGGVPESRNLDDFISTVKQRMERISGLVDHLAKQPDLSQQQLMQIQFEVMQMGIYLDVASKIGDKGSQALQTLFRDK